MLKYIFIYHSFFSTNNINKILYIISGENMRRRFRTKKKVSFKYLVIIIIFVIVSAIFNYMKDDTLITISNNKLIRTMLQIENKYVYEGVKQNYFSQNIYEYLDQKIFNSPTNLLKDQLVYEEDNSKLISFLYVENKTPLIYIYNSHQGETYSREYLEEYNIVPDVLMASNMLKDKLDNIGIYTEVENSDILAYMKENKLNHGGSYIASRHFLINAMKKYPNSLLYIDLHRDSANHSITTTTINEKPCARIMFVIGLEYDTYKENLKTVTEINNKINNKYPSLSRGILKKQGKNVNGVYNQDLGSNIILIEVGGNENNIEEINNTLDLIAEILGEYINEKR